MAKQIVVNEVTLDEESGFENNQKIVFQNPRTVDYRANVNDIARYLLRLMSDAPLREKIGKAAREHVTKNFDYRIVAKRFTQIISSRLGIN